MLQQLLVSERLNNISSKLGADIDVEIGERISAQVEDVYGEVNAIFVVGSLAAGYGHPGSDLDIYVATDAERIVGFPAMSFEGDVRYDVTYFSLETLEREVAFVSSGDDGRPTNSDRWLKTALALNDVMRFVTGIPLMVADKCKPLVASLEDPLLTERVALWWENEADRRAAASWALGPAICDRHVQLAADSVLCGLEADLARRGQPYLKPKWLMVKLAMAGMEAEQGLVKRVLRTASDAGDPAARLAAIRAFATEAGRPDLEPTPFDRSGFAVDLNLARGARVYRIDDRIVCSRWARRFVEVDEISSVLESDETMVIEPSEEITPEQMETIHRLADANMIWIGVRGTT